MNFKRTGLALLVIGGTMMAASAFVLLKVGAYK